MPSGELSLELIARRFIDAFNEGDADGLIALSDAAIEFHPTTLVGRKQRYDGHEGLRRWLAEVQASGLGYQVGVREIRPREDGFVLLSEVRLDGKLITPSAMVARLNDEHAIVEAHAFLTDAELLAHVGVMPDEYSGTS